MGREDVQRAESPWCVVEWETAYCSLNSAISLDQYSANRNLPTVLINHIAEGSVSFSEHWGVIFCVAGL